MSQTDVPYSANLLLQAMADADLETLKPHLMRVEMEREQVLIMPGEPIEHIYFPEGGVASVVSNMLDTSTTEIGLFGREGRSGTGALLGVNTTPTKTFIQVDGSTALRIELAHLRAAALTSPTLQTLLMRYIHTVFTQVAHCAVSNAHHNLEARLARWLLMCHDRIDGDELFLTHDFMSMMIGVQRTGVTVTLHILEGGGSIRSSAAASSSSIARNWRSWRGTPTERRKPNTGSLSARSEDLPKQRDASAGGSRLE